MKAKPSRRRTSGDKRLVEGSEVFLGSQSILRRVSVAWAGYQYVKKKPRKSNYQKYS